MAGIFDDPNWGNGLPDVFSTSMGIGSGSTYDTPRTGETVTTDAIQSMQPVTEADSGWSSFFRDMTKGVLGYSLQKDAVRSGVIQPAMPPGQYQGQPGQVYRQQAATGGGGGGGGNLLPLLILGGLVMALRK